MYKINVEGIVGNDPVKFELNGKEKIKLNVAVYDGKTKDGIRQTEWVEIVADVNDAIVKKSKVKIVGRSKINAYVAKDGTAKANLVIYAYEVNIVDSFFENNNDAPF